METQAKLKLINLEKGIRFEKIVLKMISNNINNFVDFSTLSNNKTISLNLFNCLYYTFMIGPI